MFVSTVGLSLPIDYYAYAGLFNFFTSGVFTFYVLSNKPEKKLARLFCIFSAGVAIWSLFYFLFLKATDRALSEFFLRTCMLPVAFLPSSFFHFVTEFVQRRISVWVHVLNYLLSTVIALTVYTNVFAIGGAPQHLVFPFWLKPGAIFPIHVLHFVGVVLIAHIFLLKAIHESFGLRRAQVLMVFWGTLIAFVSGIMNYLTWYRTPIPPVLMPLVSMLVFAMGYAIVRHQLFDIRVALRKSLVYSALIACITAAYLVMVLVMERSFAGFFGYRSLVATVIVAGLIALGFNPLRERIQGLIDRAVFSGTPPELAAQREQLLGEIRKGEQLKAVATLAAGLAHEVKNPLASIKTFTEHLETHFDDPSFRAKFTKIVGGEVERINLIVQQLLEFAKPVPPKLAPMQLAPLIDQTLDFLGQDCLARRIEIRRDYQTPGPLLGDASQLKQVVLNLFLNSLEAMNGHGGRLTVTTRQDGAELLLTVTDTGAGIAPEHLPHLGEPFYTTKPQGTGLGLAVVQGILKEHGGRLAVTSQVGRGTTVSLYFPSLK